MQLWENYHIGTPQILRLYSLSAVRQENGNAGIMRNFCCLSGFNLQFTYESILHDNHGIYPCIHINNTIATEKATL